MTRFASLSSSSDRVRGQLQARLYYARENNREKREARNVVLSPSDFDVDQWVKNFATIDDGAGDGGVDRMTATGQFAHLDQSASMKIGGRYELFFDIKQVDIDQFSIVSETSGNGFDSLFDLTAETAVVGNQESGLNMAVSLAETPTGFIRLRALFTALVPTITYGLWIGTYSATDNTGSSVDLGGASFRRIG